MNGTWRSENVFVWKESTAGEVAVVARQLSSNLMLGIILVVFLKSLLQNSLTHWNDA